MHEVERKRRFGEKEGTRRGKENCNQEVYVRKMRRKEKKKERGEEKEGRGKEEMTKDEKYVLYRSIRC